MNVLQNLIELYDRLPFDSTYRAVVKGILLNLQAAAEANVYELAELTASSRTTIWRMLQMLGYENYGAFHHALKTAVRKYTFYNRIVPAAAADEEAVVSEVAVQLEAATKAVDADLVPAKLVKMSERILKAGSVSFFFPYRTAAIKSFQQNLAAAEIDSDVACLLTDMLYCAKHLKDGSIVFFMTVEYAETQDMTEVFENLEKHDAYTVLFSGDRSRYDLYVKEQVCKGAETAGVLSSVVRFESYIFALSEVFRRVAGV